jgi:hypothetical protein
MSPSSIFSQTTVSQTSIGQKLPFTVGFGLLLIPVFTLLITSTVFWCGGSIQPFMFPLGVAFSIITLLFVVQRNMRLWLFSLLWIVGIVAVSFFVAQLAVDYSYDGQWYHQEMIWQLANGWNPFKEHHAPQLDILTGATVWVNHYGKGMETVQATIYSLTNIIEISKAVNFILIVAAGLLFFTFLQRVFNSFSIQKQVFFTILFLLCPIVLRQAFTFLIDWALYALLLTLIPALIMYEKNQSRTALATIAAVVLLAASIKFNFLFWCSFAILCYIMYWLYKKKYQTLRKVLVTCVVSGIVAVAFVNYNPYVSNSIDHKHPLYPLMGEGKKDIMSSNTPFSLREKSPIAQVLISLFAHPNVYLEWRGTAFHVSEYHFCGMKSTDSRLGGFGGFFSWAMLISIGLLVASAIRGKDMFRNKRRLPYSIFAGILFLSLFILPSSWWARYVPFFYTFPLIICLYFESEHPMPIFKKLRFIIYIMLIINAVAAIRGVCRVYNDFTEKVNNIHTVMMQSPEPIIVHFGENMAMKIKVDKAELPYKAVTDKEVHFGIGIVPDVFFDSTQCEINNEILQYKTHNRKSL